MKCPWCGGAVEKRKEPEPAPRDWHLHIERDVAWMLKPDATQFDREQCAARIRDMIYRVKDIGVAK